MAIFTLFQAIWRTEVTPESWQESTIHQLFKGKGSQNELDNKDYLVLRIGGAAQIHSVIID